MCIDFRVFSEDGGKGIDPSKDMFPQLSKLLSKLPERVRRVWDM